MSDSPENDLQTFEIRPDPEHMSKPKNTPPPVKPPRVARQPAPPPAPEEPGAFETAFASMIDRHIASGNEVALNTIDFMQKYVDEMAPEKKVGNDEGAEKQQKFFRSLRSLIEKSSTEDFRRAWNIVLAFFWRYKKGALGEQYVNRFAEFWPPKDDSLTAYQRIVNLALVSSDPQQRNGVARRVNINKTMEVGFTETGRSNIITFYAS